MIEPQEVIMELDTGALLSLINEVTLQRLDMDRSALQEAQVHLHTYTKEEILILGSRTVAVHHK